MEFTKTRIAIFIFSLLLPQTVLSAYIFTAPPRETVEDGNRLYQPIAEFLSKKTGQKFEYKQQTSWPDYVRGMREEQYDIIFDGPHFVDWRIHNLQHHTVVKIPHLLQWRVIAREGDNSITRLEDLVGKKTCAPGSPNFGMLNLFSHFPDPDKQPIHVKVKGWNNVYESVKNGNCVAGVLPKKNHQIYDKKNKYTKSIHTHLPYPNQAITTSKKISEELREKIREALLSDEGQEALQQLRKRYTGGTKLVSAEDEEYDSIHTLLLKANTFTHQGSSLNENKYNQIVNN